jgi:Sec7-like guanine-nucleotide exchange factor
MSMNVQGVFPGGDLSDSFLKDIYDRIKNRELKTGLDHVSQVSSSHFTDR